MLSEKDRKLLEVFIDTDTKDFRKGKFKSLKERRNKIIELIEQNRGKLHLEIASYSNVGLCMRRLFISGAPLSEARKLFVTLCTCGNTIYLSKNGKGKTIDWRTGKKTKACPFEPL